MSEQLLACSPDCECFSCKCRYWRQHGMNVAIPQQWCDQPTVREQEKQAIADAQATGRPFDLSADKYKHW